MDLNQLPERVSGAVSQLRDRTAEAVGVAGGMGHGELSALGRKVDRLESAVSDRIEALRGSLGQQLSEISAEERPTTWPSKFFWLLVGAGIGAAAMYLRDPDQGEDRRSELTERVTERGREAASNLKVEAREVIERARGKVVETVEDVLETKLEDGSELPD